MPRAKKSPAEKVTKKRALAARYGIAEWFGKDITKMSAFDRMNYGQIALRQDQTKDLTNSPVCPFRSVLVPDAPCNKAGGVCSIRRFVQEDSQAEGPVFKGKTVNNDKIVTVCPSRFLELDEHGSSILSIIGDKMIAAPQPIVVRETPFLRKLAGTSTPTTPPPITEPTSGEDTTLSDDVKSKDIAEEVAKTAGRIDWLVVDPSDLDKEATDLDWCAVEMQSVYFSGGAMKHEFEAYALGSGDLLYPVKHRRPDYRSSGPKRLAPQLVTKVPVMREWGNKLAVVVDKFFFSNMSDLPESNPKAKTEADRRKAGAIAWFFVDYDDDLRLYHDSTIYASIEKSIEALNATAPVEATEFNKTLKALIKESITVGSTRLGTKVFSTDPLFVPIAAAPDVP